MDHDTRLVGSLTRRTKADNFDAGYSDGYYGKLPHPDGPFNTFAYNAGRAAGYDDREAGNQYGSRVAYYDYEEDLYRDDEPSADDYYAPEG